MITKQMIIRPATSTGDMLELEVLGCADSVGLDVGVKKEGINEGLLSCVVSVGGNGVTTEVSNVEVEMVVVESEVVVEANAVELAREDCEAVEVDRVTFVFCAKTADKKTKKIIFLKF